jgi:putative ABC transport system permease protein
MNTSAHFLDAMSALPKPKPFIVSRLAVKDLLHERLLSICIIIALSAAVAPTLVLFGLKSGVIGAMRADLVEDPVFREIRPKNTRAYGEAFFTRYRQHPATEFMIESTTRGASIIRMTSTNGASKALDMLATAMGDPLLVQYHVNAPKAGEAVLTQRAAEVLGVTIGDTLTANAIRIEKSGRIKATQKMRVTGILPVRADALQRAYLPLAFTIDIESFREGFAVRDRGWKGSERTPQPAYDGVLAVTPKAISAIDRAQMLANTTFALANPSSEERYREIFAKNPPEQGKWLDITTIDQPAYARSIKRIERRLSRLGGNSFPYTRPLGLQVVAAEHFDPASAKTLTTYLWQGATPGLREVALPQSWNLPVGTPLWIEAKTNESVVQFPAKVGLLHEMSGKIGVSVKLAATLRRGQDHTLEYIPELDQFRLQRTGFRGFRLYAKSIDDVPALYNALAAEGVETIAQVQTILRIQSLDNGLKSLFWLIAAVSFVGASLVMTANQYGAVERKQGQLAHLRLMGVSRKGVAVFPIYQGIALAILGGALGVGIAFLLQGAINAFFATSLGFDTNMSTIGMPVALIGLLLPPLVAAFTSVLAAIRATQIDPAEGIRNE